MVGRAIAVCGVIVVLAMPGCAIDPCAGVDDVLAGPGGAELTRSEHEAGWGNDACTQCHSLESTHQVNCTLEPDLDLEAIREEAEDGEYETCARCHGDNGVAP